MSDYPVPDTFIYGPPALGNRNEWQLDVGVMIDGTDHIEFVHKVCNKRCDTQISWSDPYTENGARKTYLYVKCPRCKGCKRWTSLRKMYINKVVGKF